MLTWGQDNIFKELTIVKKWKFEWSKDLILYKEELNKKLINNTCSDYMNNLEQIMQGEIYCNA